MRSRSFRQEGVIIRRANVGETDKILTLLTLEGKLSVVAKGIRKLSSRKAGSLELFTQVRLQLAETSGLPIVSEAEIIQSFPRLRTDFQATSQAFWAAELIDRLVGDEVASNLYHTLLDYLARIDRGANELDVLAFELAALGELGWQPQLTDCAHCGHRLTPSSLAWSHKLGGVIDGDCLALFGSDRPISLDAVKALRLLSEQQLTVSHRLQTTAKVQAELSEILHAYLESISERRWHSPTLLASAPFLADV